MVFSSLIFLWFFLPVMLIGVYLLPDKWKNMYILAGSLFFYAWGEPKYIFLMLFSIVANWLFGLLIERFHDQRKMLLVMDIVMNLGLLGYFKYFNFLTEIVNMFFGCGIAVEEIPLPIGISFFTFQILSYEIDLYRGKYAAQNNLINLALYISFFPQLIAGPIVKYKDINEQLNRRKMTVEKTAEGIRRFIYGFGKKVIIANTVSLCVDTIYSLDCTMVTGFFAWCGAILYTLQIYYDFSGYSDMAIGLGKMFGFEFLENFNYPYQACSIQEFWQRWHISLGTWFKEYLYIPLGGNRKGTVRTYINLIIVFFMTGLWHGASFNFILWGLYHGFFQIAERLGFRKVLDRHQIFAHLYTIMVFIFGWVLFRADDLMQAGRMVKRMILPWNYTESTFVWGNIFGAKTVFIIIIGILGCGIIQPVLQKCEVIVRKKNSWVEMLYCGLILVLCIAMLAGNTYNPFIYFRF